MSNNALVPPTLEHIAAALKDPATSTASKFGLTFALASATLYSNSHDEEAKGF